MLSRAQLLYKTQDLISPICGEFGHKWLAVLESENAAVEKVGSDARGVCHDRRELLRTGADPLSVGPGIMIANTQ